MTPFFRAALVALAVLCFSAFIILRVVAAALTFR